MDIQDQILYGTETGGRPVGDVQVIPRDASGMPLKDPFVIFGDRQEAARSCVLHSDGSVSVGFNLFVNRGREVIANLLGGRGLTAPGDISQWVVSKISFGTYDEVPRFTDVSLSPQPVPGKYQGGENEIQLDGENFKKQLVSVDWPSPYIVRFEAILGLNEANGFLIREMGLWTMNENLVARKTITPIQKSSDYSLSFLWRIRT